jgi:hypothetical protein
MDDDGPLDTLRHRSHVMCAVMERLSNESHNPEFDAYFAHAKDLHAAVVAIEQRLKEMKESEIDLRGGFNA